MFIDCTNLATNQVPNFRAAVGPCPILLSKSELECELHFTNALWEHAIFTPVVVTAV